MHIRYIFADVVGFTKNRTLEAQVEIIAALNKAFKDSISVTPALYLPTGDGICAGLLESEMPADHHLVLALRILRHFFEWSQAASANRKSQLRMAINESVDAIFIDINGRRNLAGKGINTAQRLLTVCDPNQLIVGRSSFETLQVRDEYVNAFREFTATVKHSQTMTAYQYIKLNSAYLNIAPPACTIKTPA